jgi:hypothetical protein
VKAIDTTGIAGELSSIITQTSPHYFVHGDGHVDPNTDDVPGEESNKEID